MPADLRRCGNCGEMRVKAERDGAVQEDPSSEVKAMPPARGVRANPTEDDFFNNPPVRPSVTADAADYNGREALYKGPGG